MSREQAVRAWLRARGAETVDHPGGTLYAHLGRVHDRLTALGHPPHVALAGLAHAAYGTDGFDLTLLDVADRAVLRELTGPEAEDLIYLYGACDRSRTWQPLPDTHQVWDRFTGAVHTLAPEQVRPFADLSLPPPEVRSTGPEGVRRVPAVPWPAKACRARLDAVEACCGKRGRASPFGMKGNGVPSAGAVSESRKCAAPSASGTAAEVTGLCCGFPG
jgi:hypothetical protein